MGYNQTESSGGLHRLDYRGETIAIVLFEGWHHCRPPGANQGGTLQLARPRLFTAEERKEHNRTYMREYFRAKTRKKRHETMRRRPQGDEGQLTRYQARIPSEVWDVADRVHPPESVLAERKHRESLEQTPNQIILGDPPKGYSALDRRTL